MADLESRSRLWVMLPLALAVALGDAFTWFVFSFTCSIGENFTGPFVALCGRNLPQPQVHLPGLGLVVLTASIVAAHRRGTYALFAGGLLFAVAAGAVLWVLYGDPAGNFGGLLG